MAVKKGNKKMTDKQRKFCEEYLIDFNATQAAIRAGYSERTARSVGNENLTKPDIQIIISELKNKATEKNEITVDRVLKELASIAFFNMQDLYDARGVLRPINELPREVAAAISEIRTDEIGSGDGPLIIKRIMKAHAKQAALESLGKYLGIYDKDNSQKKTSINIINLGSGEAPEEAE